MNSFKMLLLIYFFNVIIFQYNVIARRSGDVIMAQLNGDYKHNVTKGRIIAEESISTTTF